VGAHDVDEIDSLNNLLEELRESIETSLNKRENDKAAMIASLKEIHNEMQVRGFHHYVSSIFEIHKSMSIKEKHKNILNSEYAMPTFNSC
jgi:uncharacterized protein (UPF0335 family)